MLKFKSLRRKAIQGTGYFGGVASEPVWPALLAGGFSPDDVTFFSTVVVVLPPGLDTVSLSLTLDSSLQPLNVRHETAPARTKGARKRFIG